MENYYKELDLDPSLSLAELTRELNRAYNIWVKRQTNGHPDAMKKLVLLEDAREAFRDEASRAEYDRKLAEADAPSGRADPDAQRREAYERWVGAAESYLGSGESGLAKAALENATHFADHASGDASFEYLAARVYRSTYDCQAALDHINQAIVLAPGNAEYEIERALIYSAMGYDAPSPREATRSYERAVEVGRVAAEKAARLGDERNEGVALGLVSFWLRFKTGATDDEAEVLAKRAISLGDSWGNAQKVVDDLEKKRAEARAAAEAERRELERKRAEEERRKREAEEAELEKRREARFANIEAIIQFTAIPVGILGLFTPAYFPYFGWSPVVCTWATLVLQSFSVLYIDVAIYDDITTDIGPIGLVLPLLYIFICGFCYTTSAQHTYADADYLADLVFAWVVLLVFGVLGFVVGAYLKYKVEQ